MTTDVEPIAAEPATAAAPPALLTATNVRRTFRMGTADLPVLRAVDFQLRSGEFVAIEGRSGSGKSTLLHVLAALDSVDGGSMTFTGADYTRRTPRPPGRVRMAVVGGRGERPWAFWTRVVVYSAVVVTAVALLCLGWPLVQHAIDPVRWPDEPTRRQARDLWWSGGLLAAVVLLTAGRWVADLAMFSRRLLGERPAAALRNAQFGFVFQSYHLLPELNVLENTLLSPSITFTSRAFWSRRAELRARATDLLTRLGLGNRLRHRVAHLSGGERQRVAIARALMNNPQVLFADEPTGNLDAETGRQIMDVLEGLHRDHGQTIVMVTHDRALAREADRVLVLKDGRLEAVDG